MIVDKDKQLKDILLDVAKDKLEQLGTSTDIFNQLDNLTLGEVMLLCIGASEELHVKDKENHEEGTSNINLSEGTDLLNSTELYNIEFNRRGVKYIQTSFINFN